MKHFATIQAAYSIINCVNHRLKKPIMVKVHSKKGRDYSGMYNDCGNHHKITIIMYPYHKDTKMLTETVLHELQHAKQVEHKNMQDLVHDKAFFRALDLMLTKFGIEKTSKEHKKDCRELGRLMGNSN